MNTLAKYLSTFNNRSQRRHRRSPLARQPVRRESTPPRIVAALLALAGLVAALIAIFEAPPWVIGGFIAAFLGIVIFHPHVLTWPPATLHTSAIAVIVAAGVTVGYVMGLPTDKVDKNINPSRTGCTNGKCVEQEALNGVETFHVPGVEATKTGLGIQPNQFVRVSCRLYVPGVPSAHPDGFWYKIVSRPWNNTSFAPANSFWNGSNVIKGPDVKNTDWKVPICK